MSTTSSEKQHHQLLSSTTNRSNVANVVIPQYPSHTIIFPSVSKKHSSLSAFEKIKLETHRTTAHGHPLILPTDYGNYGPVFDVIALYHNAIKRQAIVAYNILEALHRFKYQVTPLDINLFFDWFHTFEQVVVTILAVEEQQVFPFLHQHGVLIPHHLNKNYRTNVRHNISKTLENISQNLETIRLLAAGESVSRISSVVGQFLQVLLDYFEIQRTSLPTLVVAAHIPTNVADLLPKNFVRALYTRDNAAITLPFVSHWLSFRQLAQFKKANLTRLNALRFEKWKKSFSSRYQEIPVTIITNLTSSSASRTPRGNNKSTQTTFRGRKSQYHFR